MKKQIDDYLIANARIKAARGSGERPMNVGSLFSGVGMFDLAFQRSGFDIAWQVEIDRQCRSVLGRHFPSVPKFEDVRKCGRESLSRVDVICGGSPCQDFSVAGIRKGIQGDRSSLVFEFTRIVRQLLPALVLFENVPGLLSSHAGRDFAFILREFRECGARDIAWRILDSQYFGVAQQRKRVFLVADFRGERAGEILFESPCVCRHPAKGREAKQEVAGTLGGGTARRGWSDDTDRMTFIPGDYFGSFGVRRLTPRECERLMGLPDDWTRYGAGGEEFKDGPRYRMVGNGIVVPVAEWIAKRISTGLVV